MILITSAGSANPVPVYWRESPSRMDIYQATFCQKIPRVLGQLYLDPRNFKPRSLLDLMKLGVDLGHCVTLGAWMKRAESMVIRVVG